MCSSVRSCLSTPGTSQPSCRCLFYRKIVSVPGHMSWKRSSAEHLPSFGGQPVSCSSSIMHVIRHRQNGRPAGTRTGTARLRQRGGTVATAVCFSGSARIDGPPPGERAWHDDDDDELGRRRRSRTRVWSNYGVPPMACAAATVRHSAICSVFASAFF